MRTHLCVFIFDLVPSIDSSAFMKSNEQRLVWVKKGQVGFMVTAAASYLGPGRRRFNHIYDSDITNACDIFETVNPRGKT